MLHTPNRGRFGWPSASILGAYKWRDGQFVSDGRAEDDDSQPIATLRLTSEAWMAPHVSTDVCARASACAPDDGGWGSYLSLISGLLSVMQARTEIGPAFVCVCVSPSKRVVMSNQPANKTNGFSLFE